jgi:23S rRNA C2498 (ribose-2'-O)-methylase RlmM
MNRRSFLTAMAVTTACAVPAVGALVMRNGFERTLAAEVAKPRGMTLIDYARSNPNRHRLAVIEMFEKNNDLLRSLTYTEVDSAAYTYVREIK